MSILKTFVRDRTAPLFKQDDMGRTCFFPWGSLARGFIVADNNKRKQVENIFGYFSLSAIILGILCGSIPGGWAFVLFLIPFFIFNPFIVFDILYYHQNYNQGTSFGYN